MHEISFYYLMDFTHLNIEESNFTLIENEKNVVSGFVWIDENQNGQKDKAETYLQGIKVTES